MRKVRVVLILGGWVAVLPYLGIPYFWKNVLFSLSGLGLIYIGFLLYKEYQAGVGAQAFDNFSENKDFKETTPSA